METIQFSHRVGQRPNPQPAQLHPPNSGQDSSPTTVITAAPAELPHQSDIPITDISEIQPEISVPSHPDISLNSEIPPDLSVRPDPYLTFIAGIQTEVRDIFSEIDSTPLPAPPATPAASAIQPPVVRRNSHPFWENDWGSDVTFEPRHFHQLTICTALIGAAFGVGILAGLRYTNPDAPQAACDGPQAAGIFNHNVTLHDYAKLNTVTTATGASLMFPVFGFLLLRCCSAALSAHISNSNTISTINFVIDLMACLGVFGTDFAATVYYSAVMLPLRNTTDLSLSEFGQSVLKSHNASSLQMTELKTQLLHCQSLVSESDSVIGNITLTSIMMLTFLGVTFCIGIPCSVALVLNYSYPRAHNPAIVANQGNSAGNVPTASSIYTIAPIADRITGVSRDPNAIPPDYRELKIAVMDHIISEWRQLSDCETIAPDVTESLIKLVGMLENCDGNDSDTKFDAFKATLICQISYEYPILAAILVNCSGFRDVEKPNIVDIEYMVRYVTRTHGNGRIPVLPPTEGSIIGGTAINSHERFNFGTDPGVYKFVPIHRELALLSIIDRLISADQDDVISVS